MEKEWKKKDKEKTIEGTIEGDRRKLRRKRKTEADGGTDIEILGTSPTLIIECHNSEFILRSLLQFHPFQFVAGNFGMF